MAINTAQQDEPLIKTAYKKMERLPDGTPYVAYYDASTGQRLASTAGYVVITAGNLENPSFVQTQPEAVSNNNPADEPVKDTGLTESERRKMQLIEAGRSSENKPQSYREFGNRTASNNYGYRDTPEFLNLASFLPGPIGTVSKAAKAGFNLNNLAATNEARQTIGLGSNANFGSIVGSVLGLRDPSKVASVSINNKPYSVGLTATNQKGQTNLTPEEARQRALVTQGTLPTELTKQQNQTFANNSKASGNTMPSRGIGGFAGGIAGGIANAARSVGQAIGGFFGGSGANGASAVGYPDAPSPSTERPAYSPSYSSVNSGGSGFRSSGGSGSISPETERAISGGAGGLF